MIVSKTIHKKPAIPVDDPDSRFLDPSVPLSTNINHVKWTDFLSEKFNKKNLRILEIGSREVCGKSTKRIKEFSEAEYVGMDLYEGNNVDVVGDAHKLTTLFDEPFDLIFSSSCFEHFAMPWVVAEEISKLLNPSGFVFVETHFSFGSHERPWHFFQFSDMALRALFNKNLGFECIECGCSNPIIGKFSNLADEYLRNKPVAGLYCHSEYFGQKIHQPDIEFDWNKVDLNSIVNNTSYPKC